MSSFVYQFPPLHHSRRDRNAERVRSYAKLIAYSRMRHKFNLPLYGEDRELDGMLERIVDNFFEHDPGEKNPSPGKGNDENLFGEILRWLENDTMSSNDRETYLRVSCWVAAKNKDEDQVRAITSEHKRIYGKSLEPLKDAQIERTYLEFRERFRKNRQILRDSKEYLVRFSLETLTRYALPFISVISIFIIIGGYLHVFIFYSYLGIPVSNFFSLDDYLASSIKEIAHSIWILLVFLSVILWGYPQLQRSAQLKQPLGMRKSIRQAKVRIIQFHLSLFIMLAGIVWYLIIDKGLFSGWMAYLVGLSVVYPVAFILTFRLARKFFSNTLPAQIVLLSAVIFFLSIGLGTYNRIEEIREQSCRRDFEIKVGNQSFTKQRYSFVGGSQHYIFLRSNQDGKIKIVHRLKAEEISISPDEDHFIKKLLFNCSKRKAVGSQKVKMR